MITRIEVDTLEKNNRENLSPAWKKRFEILDRIDGDLFRSGKKLSQRERFSVSIRVWALIFAPFYYFKKGMWEKSLVLWIIGLLSMTAIDLTVAIATSPVVATSISDKYSWMPMSILFGTFATTDYYAKVVHGEKLWQSFSKLPAFLISLPALVIALIISIALYFVIAGSILIEANSILETRQQIQW